MSRKYRVGVDFVVNAKSRREAERIAEQAFIAIPSGRVESYFIFEILELDRVIGPIYPSAKRLTSAVQQAPDKPHQD